MHGILPDRRKSRPRDLGRGQRHRPNYQFAEQVVRSLTGVRPIATSALLSGTVVVARVPFPHGKAGDKIRYAEVVSATSESVEVRPLTTSALRAELNKGLEVILNRRKQWIYPSSVRIERSSVLAISPERVEYPSPAAFSVEEFGIA